MELLEAGEVDSGKQFVCSAKDLKKMNTNEGCVIRLVDKPISLANDDDDTDVSDEGNFSEEETVGRPAPLSQKVKEERLKKEFISLALNTNRDPMKGPSECRLKKLLEGEDIEQDFPDYGSPTKMVDPAKIHRQYERLGNYEELLANKENLFLEISPKRVYKRQLYAGVGTPVSEDSFVVYNYAFWIENAREPFDSTWLRHNTITTDMGSDSILPGLYELLLTTKRGEFCEALIRPEAAFGMLGVKPRIPPKATIFCLLEVVSVVAKDKMTKLASKDGFATFEDFYQASDEARTRGNYFIEQRQYNVALQRYKAGIRILEYQSYMNEDQEKKANLLLLKLYNNSAKAAIQLGNPLWALAACKQASLIENYEPKTHWYRMAAWKKKGDFDRALRVCRRALQLFPDASNQKVFGREAEKLKTAISKQQQEIDDLYRLMGRSFSTQNQ